MTLLQFVAWGRPVGQGNHRQNRWGAAYEATKGHAAWRTELIRAATQAMNDLDNPWTTLTDAVHVGVTFYGPRPASHYGTGRNAGILKADAPMYPITKDTGRGLSDIDKLCRSVLDALTIANVIADDALVTDLLPRKRFAEQPTGARALIVVYPQLALVGSAA